MSHITRHRPPAERSGGEPTPPHTTIHKTEVHHHTHKHVGALWIAGAMAATNLGLLGHFVLHWF